MFGRLFGVSWETGSGRWGSESGGSFLLTSLEVLFNIFLWERVKVVCLERGVVGG